MKRFSATERFAKAWFQKLPCRLKVFWDYLCAHCDCAGVWEANFELASFQIGEQVTEADMASFEHRIERISPGKFWLTGFVEFQYGTLSETCNPHKRIIECLKKHRLLGRVLEGYKNPTGRVEEEDKDKEEEEDKEKEKGESEGKTKAKEVLAYLNERAERDFRPTETNLTTIRCRLEEVGMDVAAVKVMIDRQCAKWKGDPKMDEFLRPATLFGKEKFSQYFGSRLAPLPKPNGVPNHPAPLTQFKPREELEF